MVKKLQVVNTLREGSWIRIVQAVLNLYVDKPSVKLIKHCHPTKQTKEKNRSINCTCLHRIAFVFSLLS